MTNSNYQKAQIFYCNIWALVVIIIITGIIGGLINHLLTEYEGSNKKDVSDKVNTTFSFFNSELCLQILLGICGSALIPLFLYLTSSGLFNQPDNNLFVYLVFTGYCFIGSIFSKSLLKSLAKRLDLEKFQEELKNTKQELDKTKAKANEAEKFIIENKKEEEENNPAKDSFSIDKEYIKEEIGKFESEGFDIDKYISEDAIKDLESVLKELQNPKYKDRSIKGLANKTRLNTDTVWVMLQVLIRLELVQKVQWYGNKFYRLTEKGKKVDVFQLQEKI